jgi:hypothetical protein
MDAPFDKDSYQQEVEAIVDGFQYEYCESCGGDLDDHVIAPDAFGHAHAWCARACGEAVIL